MVRESETFQGIGRPTTSGERLQPQELRSQVGPLISEFAHTLRFECPPFIDALANYYSGGASSNLPFFSSSEQMGKQVRFTGRFDDGRQPDDVLWDVNDYYTLGEQTMIIKRAIVEDGRHYRDLLIMNGTRFIEDPGSPESSDTDSYLSDEVKAAQAQVDSHIMVVRWDVTGVDSPDMFDLTGGELVGQASDSQTAVVLAQDLMESLMGYGYTPQKPGRVHSLIQRLRRKQVK